MGPRADGRSAQFRWGRASLAAIAVLVSVYLVLASGAFMFLRHRRHVAVGLTDVVAPWRWHRVRIARGAQLINEAFALARTGRHREASMYLHAGLTQVPAHRGGRLLQAQLLATSGRKTEEARQLLLDGLSFHAVDPKYLHAVFSFLLEAQDDETIVALARNLLPQLAAQPEAARVAALAGATASFLRGNFAMADVFIETVPRLAQTRDARLLRTRIEWDRGYHDLAVVTLRTLSADFSDDAEIRHELIRRLRDLGATDEARRQSIAFQIAQPGAPAARIELLRAYAESDDTNRFDREAEAACREFAGDPAALLALADFAATTGKPDLIRRLGGHSDRFDPTAPAHAFLLVEAQLVNRDYRGALESIRALQRNDRALTESYRALLDCFQSVAYLGLGERETSRMYLASFLLQPALRADNLLVLANRFVALDAAEQAHRILARAVAIDPRNQPAVTRLVELDLNLNRIDELPAHLHQLVALRQPSPDVLRVARHKLGSDLFLFSQDRAAVLEEVTAALESKPAKR